jgi:hypothetical protein
MSEGIPADEGNAQPATSVAGMEEAAAGVEAGNNDAGGGEQPDMNDYGKLLAEIGRTEDEDHRIAVHEAGHAVAARLLGHPLGGATVDPGPGFAGRVWGERHAEAFAIGRGDASDVREALEPLMPSAGEDHSSRGDIFGYVYNQCIEFMAGRAAEVMLLEGDPVVPADDLRQARELALLICKSEEAIKAFIAYCDVAARDLLMPRGDVVIVLSTVLRIKRTLDGAEIDEIISDVQARKAMAIEHRRRADWRRRELAASSHRAECVRQIGCRD